MEFLMEIGSIVVCLDIDGNARGKITMRFGMLQYASLSKLLVCLFAYSAVTSGSSCLEQLYAYGPSTPGPLPCSIRHFECLDRSFLA